MLSPPEDDAPRHIHKADSGTRMPVEIERKFLVANDGWRSAVIDSEKLRDITRHGRAMPEVWRAAPAVQGRSVAHSKPH